MPKLEFRCVSSVVRKVQPLKEVATMSKTKQKGQILTFRFRHLVVTPIRCTSGWSNCPATYVIDDNRTTVASILATIPNRLDGSLHFIINDFSFAFARDHFASSQQNNSAAIASTCFALLYRTSQSAVQPPLWQAVHRADFSVPVSASAPALRRGGC